MTVFCVPLGYLRFKNFVYVIYSSTFFRCWWHSYLRYVDYLCTSVLFIYPQQSTCLITIFLQVYVSIDLVFSSFTFCACFITFYFSLSLYKSRTDCFWKYRCGKCRMIVLTLPLCILIVFAVVAFENIKICLT